MTNKQREPRAAHIICGACGMTMTPKQFATKHWPEGQATCLLVQQQELEDEKAVLNHDAACFS